MIEVIKHGTKKEIKCNKCGCVFTYEEEDIKQEEPRYTGYQPRPHYVVCPDCKNHVYTEPVPRPPIGAKSSITRPSDKQEQRFENGESYFDAAKRFGIWSCKFHGCSESVIQSCTGCPEKAEFEAKLKAEKEKEKYLKSVEDRYANGDLNLG